MFYSRFCLFQNAFFFLNQFFPFKVFYTKHKNLIKSNNKKNNYMNQLLRLPLLKYTRVCAYTHTHTHTHTHTRTHKENIYTYVKEKIIKRKTVPPSLPKKKKGFLQHPRRRSPRQQSRNRSRQLLPQRSPPQMS